MAKTTKGIGGRSIRKTSRTRKPSGEALCLARTLRPRGGHLPLALVADRLRARDLYSRGRPVRVKPEKLAADLNLSLPQVKRALADLQGAQLIRFQQQTRHKAKQTYGGSLYEVGKLVDRLDEIHFYMQPPPRPKRRAQAQPRVSVEETLEAARADRDAYEADRAAAAATIWGKPRYDEEIRGEVAEALREARADEQASKFEDDLALESVVETFMWAVEYVRAAWAANDAREQAQYEGPDEYEMEARSFKRQQFLEHLLVEGPALAVLDIPGYRDALFEYFPEVYAKLFPETAKLANEQ